METAPRVIQSFGESTSIHGVPRITGSKSKFRRLVWTLIFLTAMGVCSWQLFGIVMRYTRNEKRVTIENRLEMVPFPAITVCNVEPFSAVTKYPLGGHQLQVNCSHNENLQLCSNIIKQVNSSKVMELMNDTLTPLIKYEKY